jgi:hypothetical protein
MRGAARLSCGPLPCEALAEGFRPSAGLAASRCLVTSLATGAPPPPERQRLPHLKSAPFRAGFVEASAHPTDRLARKQGDLGGRALLAKALYVRCHLLTLEAPPRIAREDRPLVHADDRGALRQYGIVAPPGGKAAAPLAIPAPLAPCLPRISRRGPIAPDRPRIPARSELAEHTLGQPELDLHAPPLWDRKLTAQPLLPPDGFAPS